MGPQETQQRISLTDEQVIEVTKYLGECGYREVTESEVRELAENHLQFGTPALEPVGAFVLGWMVAKGIDSHADRPSI